MTMERLLKGSNGKTVTAGFKCVRCGCISANLTKAMAHKCNKKGFKYA